MTAISPKCVRRIRTTVLALTIAAGSASAEAQLRLPSVNLPATQAIGSFANDRLQESASRLRALRELPIVSDVRLDQLGKLLRQHGDVLEADPRGAPVVRREILAWSPSKAGREAARAAGLTVLRETRLDGLDEVMLVLQVPEHASTAALLEQLRALDPEGSYDFNHIYTGSGALGAPAAPSGDAAPRKGGALSVGLVDSGVDASHQVFQDATIERWGCDKPHPDQHGTAVAALMVGQGGDFRGVAPRARLFAADIYWQ
jgi:subtilisin family serine protease